MAFAIPLALAAGVGAGGVAATAGVGALGTMGGLAAAGSIAGAAMSGLSAIQQGQAASRAAAYNAQVAENNAKLATQNARFAAAEGNEQVAAEQQNNRARTGAIAAAQGASGVDVNSGSAVNVRASQAELGELNALNIRSNAMRQAYGYETQSTSYTGQAGLDRAQAKDEKIGGYMSGAGSFLGGVGSAALNFANFQGGSGLGSTSDIPAPTAQEAYYGS